MSETTLTYQVFVAPIIAIAGNDNPPGQSRSVWSPISATLISGRRDAVLVDPLMTVEQGMAVADWVSTTGKNLTTVYVTHGHGDHWFGLGAVRERFPGRRREHAHVVLAPGPADLLAAQVPGPDPAGQPRRRAAGRAVLRARRPSAGRRRRRAHRHRQHHGPARAGPRAGRRRRRGIQRRAPVPSRIRLWRP